MKVDLLNFAQVLTANGIKTNSEEHKPSIKRLFLINKPVQPQLKTPSQGIRTYWLFYETRSSSPE